MSGNVDFTLVVPTFNRPILLGDLLTFLASCGAPFRIIVADSSIADTQERNRRLCESLPLRIEHRGFAADTGFFDKLLAVCTMVDSPFIALCADDDLVLPDAIEASRRFLEANPDHVSCHGDYYSCLYDAGVPKLSLNIAVEAFDDEGAVDRVLHVLSRYQAVFYAVHRTEPFRRMLVRVRGIPSAHHGELYSAIAIVLAGKVGRIDRPFSVRNSSVPSVMTSGLYDPNRLLVFSVRRFFAEYLPMRRLAVRDLTDPAGPALSRESAGQVVDAGLMLYLRRCFHSPTMLHGLRDKGHIGADVCRRLVDGITQVRRDADPASVEALEHVLESSYVRGWPRGEQM